MSGHAEKYLLTTGGPDDVVAEFVGTARKAGLAAVELAEVIGAPIYMYPAAAPAPPAVTHTGPQES